MAATILTAAAAQAANIEVIQDDRYAQAVHDHVVALRAGRRSGSACAKTRGEVAGSNAKPWRQKGTGRARAGEKRSPIWRGGGVVFGPRPRDYSKKVNKKVAKVALRKAFSERVNSGDVLVVEDFTVAEPKTKQFLTLLASVTPELQTLVIADDFDDNTFLAARNVLGPLLLRAGETSTEHLLQFRKIVVTNGALTQLAQRMAITK